MKNSNLHSILIGIVLVASFCCYIFLNTVSVPNDFDSSETSIVTEVEENQSDIIMPDIDLVKKVFSKTKALLPPL